MVVVNGSSGSNGSFLVSRLDVDAVVAKASRSRAMGGCIGAEATAI